MTKFCGKCGANIENAVTFCPNCGQKLKSEEGPTNNEIRPSTKGKKNIKKPKRKKHTGLRAAAVFLIMAVLTSAVLGVLVYFDIVNVPVVHNLMDRTGIKNIQNLTDDYIQLEGTFTLIKIVDEDSAVAAVQEVAKDLKLESAAKELSIQNINTIDGVTYYRLQQNYNGIPVYGRTFVVSSDEFGNSQSLTTNSININGVNTTKKLLLDEAKVLIKEYLQKTTKSNNINVFNSHTEVIYTFNDNRNIFCYKFNAMAEDKLYDVFLGIEDKKVIACFDVNMSQVALGSGIDINDREVSFDIKKHTDTLFSMEDINRNIRVYDANNRTVSIGENFIYVIDSRGNTYKSDGVNWTDKKNNVVTVEDDNGRLQQGKWRVIDQKGNIIDENAYCVVDIYGHNTKLSPLENNSANFTNPKTVTLMSEAQRIYDFFKVQLNRTGFDNNNGSMSLVANNTKGAYSSGIAQSMPAAMLVFGSDNELSTELIAHEYMHSVESAISGMIYDGESGAIMEAYSDLFGEILEDYNDGELNGNCDWIHHAYKELGYDHSRNLKTPNSSGNPSKVGEETRPFWLRAAIEKDEVHHCSTIISHAAYAMTANQGDGTPLTMFELLNLWYRTLLTLPSSCTFSNLRESMLLTATNCGVTDDKITRISSAFSIAGIEGSRKSGEYANNIQISVFDVNSNRYGEYSIDISGQKDLPLWFTEEYVAHYTGSTEPVSVYLEKGEYTITVKDKNNPSNIFYKAITVKKDAASKELRFTTDFGTKQPSTDVNIKSTLLGEWVIDEDKTKLKTGKTMFELFGSGFKHGNLMEFQKAGEFNYYIGIGVGGQGSYSIDDSQETVHYDISQYEGTGKETGDICIISEDSKIYLMMNCMGESIYWKPTNNISIEIPEEPVRTTSDERDIVLVLDTSGSMSGTPIEEVKKASTNFISTILEEDASIGIVTYESMAYMNADFSVTKRHLSNVVQAIATGGGTNIESGLSMAEEMLKNSNAEKKIIVLMSDGEPNDGKEGDALINYANKLKEDGIIIYTLGFFGELEGYKSSAQMLMEGIASDGCHYEVADADSLVYFFGDVADQINGQKYMYIRIACPVDVTVKHNGEKLCSIEEKLNTRTGFGSLTFEENEKQTNSSNDNRIKVLRLKEGADYDIQITGNGRGYMDYTIGFVDDAGEYSDLRRFNNIKITRRTVIDTVATHSRTTILNVDEDGDGKYDLNYRATENSRGEIVDYTYVVYIAGSAIVLMLIVVVTAKTRKYRQKKKGR